jgi:uncharacterized DUF497 family protein
LNFEWDETKNLINQQKHGLDFETASLVFNDPNALSVQDRFENEERWQTIGRIEGILIILVAHTFELTENTETIRIISARKATRAERESYEKNLW